MNLEKILEDHKKWLNNEGGKLANLIGADLSDADLIGADLSDTDLSYADLSDADLRYANLSDADLRVANLSYADLRGADLRGAELIGANLREADLSEADLSDVSLLKTIGNGQEIRTMQLPNYTVVVCDDWLQIGCEGHRIHEWASFNDDEIASMGVGALDWYREYKQTVMLFAKADDFGIEIETGA